jgi:PPP family 3-phenylpropionic acid transporter
VLTAARVEIATAAVPFAKFLALYAALFTAFGALSPFLPALLSTHGLGPELVGLMLAIGTAVRLVAGPVAGRIADRFAAPRAVLSICTAAAALAGLAYLPIQGPWPLLLVSLLQSFALAPIVPLADALSLASAAPALRSTVRRRGFDYGWVRGAGSAAFIVGVVLGGRILGRLGFTSILSLNAALLAAAAFLALQVPDRIASGSTTGALRAGAVRGGIGTLLRMPMFRRLLLVAALVQGSHALHDGFAVIRWQAAGIDPSVIGLLWSEGVIGEIVVFFVVGRPILNRLGPARSGMLAAVAGVVRWAVMAQGAKIAPIALVEPLHGFTFALLHLVCMHLIRESVPAYLAATAQTVYGTLGIGLATALLTLCSGVLYARLGAGSFWVMSALCAFAIPLARKLRSEGGALSAEAAR